MDRSGLLLIILLLAFENAAGQIFRYRLSGNSSIFMSEPGEAEISYSGADAMSYPGSSDFVPGFRLGAELEIMAPVTTDFEVGVEFDYSNLSGRTPTAPLYNFFLSRNNPLPDTYKYPDEALIYHTVLLNILGTARFYFLPLNKNVNVFLKTYGGVAFVGTDFTFHNMRYREKYKVGVLYSRGMLSNEEPKQATFNGGGGLGVSYRLSDKLDIYFDGTASFIHSDIVNGVPNYDYLNYQGEETLRKSESWSIMAQVSIGLVYSAISDRRLNKGNFTRTRQFHKRIFWKKRRPNPFSKRKRR